jgi:hypothetical protein
MRPAAVATIRQKICVAYHVQENALSVALIDCRCYRDRGCPTPPSRHSTRNLFRTLAQRQYPSRLSGMRKAISQPLKACKKRITKTSHKYDGYRQILPVIYGRRTCRTPGLRRNTLDRPIAPAQEDEVVRPDHSVIGNGSTSAAAMSRVSSCTKRSVRVVTEILLPESRYRDFLWPP